MVLRRSLIPLLALLAIAAASCGGGDRPTEVAAGAGTAPSTTEASTLPPASAPPSTSTVPATGAPRSTTSTTAAADAPAQPGSGTAASPVDGLTADQLRSAVEAPLGTASRRAPGPTVDQVTLPDGTRVWRVRIPGSFRARSARVEVLVGGRRVGEGVLASDLQAITAVTTDGSGLTAGRPVAYRWEGGPSVAAGTLEVAR